MSAPTLREIYQQQIDFVNASKADVHAVPIHGTVSITDDTGAEVFLDGEDGSDFITRAHRLWNETGYLTQSEADEVTAYPYMDQLAEAQS